MAKKQVLDVFKRSHSLLNDILKETERLKILNARLPLLLNPEFLSHTQIATLNGTTLVLTADSGLFATRLRYEGQHIIRKCKMIPELCGVTQIEIKVQPKQDIPKPEMPVRYFSPERKAWLSALISDLRNSETTLKK